MLKVEPGEVVLGPECGCCEKPGRSAFGFVHRNGEPIAFYYAWLLPHVDHPAVSMAISLGDWSRAGEQSARRAAALRFESDDGEVSGSFVEPGDSPFMDRELLGRFLSVGEVRLSVLVGQFLDIAEAIVLDDPAVNSHLTS